MKIEHIELATLERMSTLMRPEHYVGFLLGGAFLALIQSPEPDTDSIQTLLAMRENFVIQQRDADEPTGNPVAPVYWTDEIQGYDDREELIACMDGGTVFALHSSVEPHMQWVARMPAGEGEFETEIFRTKAEGEKALKDLQEETRREYGIMIAEVRRLYSIGDVDGAEKRMDGWSVDFSNHRDDPGHVTVDGERMPIGPVAPLVPRPAEHHPV